MLADNVPEHDPWRGNGLYTLEMAAYLLNKGIIDKQHVTRARHRTLDIPMAVCMGAAQTIANML